MVERSRPWDGIVTGDAGPYSDDQWTDVWKTRAPIIASQGVFRDQLNDLDLSSVVASPVSVASGRALVNGIWYESDAATSLAIANATAGNVRVDRIVARASWAAQTVRLLVVQGVNVVSNPVPPALVQVDGTTWDLPLWQVQATDAGVLTFFRDERSFIGQYEPSEPTDDYVYVDDELFWPELATAASAIFYPWRVTIVGSYNVNPNEDGNGGIALRDTGATPGEVSVNQPGHRPDLINAHLIVRAKSPNTAATLDRSIGWVSSLGTLIPTNGVWFRADGNGGVTNWEAVCRSGGVETAVDTTIAQTDVYKKFEIRQVGISVVTFLIDGVVRATIQTDIPAAELILTMGIHDDGASPATNDYLHCDRIRMAGDRT